MISPGKMIENACAKYANEEDAPFDGLADALADLMIMANARGIPWDQVYERAAGYYDELLKMDDKE